jgi:two-component system response regulator RstA
MHSEEVDTFNQGNVQSGWLSMNTVMLVEDDLKLASVVRDYLQEYDYQVELEKYGDIAAERIVREQPDAVILDVNLPNLDGFSVCRQVRESYSGAIIMLTARSGEVDEVLGLEIGADDYLTKPVRPPVLLARLSLHLRRNSIAKAQADETIQVGGLKLYVRRRQVELRGTPIELKPAEFDLLLILARNPCEVIQRASLFEQVNPGEAYDYRDRSIDLRISRLRRKLEDAPQKPTRILSIRGNGYMLVEKP